MVQRLQGRDALVRVQSHQVGKKVHFHLIKLGRVVLHGNAVELGERHLEVLQLQRVWPVVFVRRSQHLEDLEDLVDLTVAHKQRLPLDHLCEDAPSRPQVHSQGVGSLSKQDLGAAVPQSDDLVGVSFNREAKSAGKSKISQLNVLTVLVDEQVLRFQVSVEYAVLM